MDRCAGLSRAQDLKSDKMEDRAFFDVLKFRNQGLSACGMKDEEAGF